MSYVKLWVRGQCVLCKVMVQRTVCLMSSHGSEDRVSYVKLWVREQCVLCKVMVQRTECLM